MRFRLSLVALTPRRGRCGSTRRYVTNAMHLLSGDQEGTLRVPSPRKSVARTLGFPQASGMMRKTTSLFGGCPFTLLRRIGHKPISSCTPPTLAP